MIRIVIPGWAIPLELYSVLNPDVIMDYGFFSSACGGGSRSVETFRLDSTEPRAVRSFTPPPVPYEVVAHSLGALAALVSSHLRDSADRVVVLGGFARFAESSDNPHGVPVSEIEAMADELKRSPARLLKRFSRLTAFPEKFRFPPFPTDPDVDKLLEGLETLRRADVSADLESMPAPAVFVHGEADAVVALDVARAAAERIPRSSFRSVPGAGHALPFTRPAIPACSP